MTPFDILFLLLAGHALADYPLQGDYLSQAKNRNHPLGSKGIWFWALTAHALINGLAVFVVTRSVVLAMVEVVAHWIIDYAKCQGQISYHLDQALHIACKLVIFVFYVLLVA